MAPQKKDTRRAVLWGGALFLLWVLLVYVVRQVTSFGPVIFSSVAYILLLFSIMLRGRSQPHPPWYTNFRMATFSFLVLFMVLGGFVLYFLFQ